ncbi:hypothetical protein LINPERPRIM_LOCUS37363 [Linum perenne]
MAWGSIPFLRVFVPAGEGFSRYFLSYLGFRARKWTSLGLIRFLRGHRVLSRPGDPGGV